MKTFLEVTISATEAQRELLLPALGELGSCGFLEENDRLISYFEKPGEAGRNDIFRADLLQVLRIFSANATIDIREIEEMNWNAEWEQSLAPVEIGSRLVVKPSWTDYANSENRIVILIDPKMSFGTGYHESTRLILALAERHLPPAATLLDVGTGTGILAIAALKLGAVAATGTDIDEWSLHNAGENILLNDVGDRMTVTDKPLSSFPSASFDILFANILRATILEMLGDFHRLVRPHGLLLLSGLLASERNVMLEALAGSGFTLIDERAENEWIALAAKRV
jgi:ribosomal protein L11 methyltransferase